jgi:hypothetical protein
MALMQQVVRDNPGIDMKKANEITNAWLGGQDTFSDGTPVPQPQGNAATILDRVNKSRTTTGALNTILNAQGAEKEVEVLSDIASDWLKPYGTTYFNMSPSQISDSFKNDEESQKKLGKFIAAQALQYDIAPARTRLAGATPGVTLTNELVNVGMQNIGARYPRLSEKARNYASKYINEALTKGFNARKNAGITASSAFSKKSIPENSEKVTKWEVKNGELVEVQK